MKNPVLLVAAALTLTVPQQLFGAVLYWDLNGTEAGAGPTPTGTWDTTVTNSNWNTDAAGLLAPGVWSAGNTAFFSAGSDAIGAFTITVSGTQTADAVIVDKGTITQSGGVIDTGSGAFTIKSGATWKIADATYFNGGGKLVLDGGTLINTYTTLTGGAFIPTAKAIEITANGGTVGYDDGDGAKAFTTIYSGTITGTGGTTANGGVGTLTKTGPDEFRYQNSGTVNSSFSKLYVSQGLFRLGSVVTTVQQTSELGFGAAPLTATADAITLDGGSLGASFALTTHANRGIYLTANGGSILGSITVAGGITGPGALTLSGTSLALTKNSSIGRILGAAGTSVAVTGSSVVLSAGDASNFDFSGLITGSGQFKKTGDGIMSIFSNWSNTGLTTIDQGTLKFAVGAAGLGGSSQVAITTGAIFDMNNIGDSFGSLTGGGNIINGKNVTLSATNVAAAVYSGSYSNALATAGTLTKNGSGNQTFTGSNGFLSATVTAGTLEIGGAGGALPAVTSLSISGGTLLLSNAGGNGRISDAAGVALTGTTTSTLRSSAAVTETFGALTLTGAGSKVIDFGADGSGSKLTFTGSVPTTALSIWNWTGNLETINGTDRLLFSTGVNNTNYANVSFFSDSAGLVPVGSGARLLDNGSTFELVPVPEPGALFAGLALLAPLAYRERRHWMRCREARA